MSRIDADNEAIWIRADEVQAGDVLADRGRVVKAATVIARSFVKIETDDSLPPLFPGCRNWVKLRSIVLD